MVHQAMVTDTMVTKTMVAKDGLFREGLAGVVGAWMVALDGRWRRVVQQM